MRHYAGFSQIESHFNSEKKIKSMVKIIEVIWFTAQTNFGDQIFFSDNYQIIIQVAVMFII